MRIGFRHCLLSSCLFRCSAGWRRWDGKAVCGYGSLCLGGSRSSRSGRESRYPNAIPAPAPGFPRSLPVPLLLLHQRYHRHRCPHWWHRAPYRGDALGTAGTAGADDSSPFLALRPGTALVAGKPHYRLPRRPPSLVCSGVFCFLSLLIYGG